MFRGIGYQQAQAVHLALDIIESGEDRLLRVEGIEDVVDIETLDSTGRRVAALQVKTRSGPPWTPKLVIDVFKRWLLGEDDGADFTFVTDQQLGPGAQAFADALEAARTGDLKPLSKIVGASSAARLSNSSVLVASDSVGSLLAGADRRAAALIDPLIRSASPTEAGADAVNALFRLLTERAGLPGPGARLIGATELRKIVGGLAGQPLDAKWPGELEALLLDTVTTSRMDLADLTVQRLDLDAEAEPASALLDSGFAILGGATGTGKSSICELVQRQAAGAGRTVIVGRAETYLAGRLDAFAADALGFTIRRALPPSTGRQLLADPRVTLIIDGASEIPGAAGAALASDLRSVVERPGMATIVLVGRGVATLRQLLPSGTPVTRFSVRPLDGEGRKHIADRILSEGVAERERDQILHRADRQLRDGANNPFLLTLYLKGVTESGTAGLSRSALYSAFLESLAARTGGVEIASVIVVLSHLFAELITKQRRYSDAYEWIQLTDELAGAHPELGIEGSQVRAAALLSGIVNPLGYTGTVAPFHDSIADYLAALGHSRGIVPTPARLTDSDEQWVTFATEQQPTMANELAAMIVRDIPFTALDASAHDRADLPIADLVVRTNSLLRELLGDEHTTVEAMELADGRRRVVASIEAPDAVIASEDGPLLTAVRIWRGALRNRLAESYGSNTPRPLDIDAAQASVRMVAKERQQALRDILATFPRVQRLGLIEVVGPLGVRAEIGEALDEYLGGDWALTYWPDVKVDVTVTLEARPLFGDGSRSTVMNYCSEGGAHAAASEVKDALEQLVGRKGWLA